MVGVDLHPADGVDLDRHVDNSCCWYSRGSIRPACTHRGRVRALAVDPRRAPSLAERDRLRAGARRRRSSRPGQMTYGSQAAAASQVFEQQRDLALRDRNQQQLAAVEAALARLDAGTLRDAASAAATPIAPGAARGPPVGRPLHRLPADRGPRWLSRRRRRRRPTAPTAPLVTIDDVRAAAATLAGSRSGRPLVPFGRPARPPLPEGRVPPADRRVQDPRRLRRGRLADDDERARGVITYSSGNHAQGVARAARLLGAPAVVVMPSDAPALKRARVEADGAEVVIVGTSSDERQQVAERDRRRARPRDHPAVRRRPDHRRARARSGWRSSRTCPTSPPSSSRSAAAGWPAAWPSRSRRCAPGARVIGVEPELAADARDSLARGPDRRAGRPSSCRGRSPTARARRRSASGRSPTSRRCSTAS